MKIALKSRYTWKNDVSNQVVQPLRYYSPESLQDIVDIIKLANSEHVTVRAVGSGHSFSDVVQTSGFLINTDGLQQILPFNKDVLKENLNYSVLVEAEGGIKIHALNEYLDAHGLALPNMGGYDGQSVAGACSTSTHGSGISLEPLTGIYRSIVLVASDATVYRIEPTNGISDPLKHKAVYPHIQLVQDDEWFRTVSVSMGCTGIIYSVIMEMIPRYWLKETRYVSNWEDVRDKLLEGSCLQDNRHFEVLVNPYKVKGVHLCLVTERNITSEPPGGKKRRKKGRHFLNALLGFMPVILKLLDYFFNHFFNIIPWFINFAMKGLADKNYVNISYNVLNLGTANYISAFSSEFAFPMEANEYVYAVDSLFGVAEKARRLGRLYHTSPISLRFVKQSESYLSMMNGRDTCTVEIPVVNYTFGGFELMDLYENHVGKFKGRVHWGQINTINTNRALLLKDYPQFNTWFDVYKQLNKNGTFNNDFTNRMGISI